MNQPSVNPPAQATRLLGQVLRDVSRSFYLSLRVLPKPLRLPMGSAYLLARAADSIADTPLLPAEQRLAELHRFQHWLQRGYPDDAQPLPALAEAQASPGEARLLRQLPRLFALLEAQDEGDRRRIRQVVATLTQGMVEDLEHFPPGQDDITALADEAQLERYTYLVAGCVGEFWTATAAAHLPGLTDCDGLPQLGVRYGQALQLLNIVRDARADLAMGRCYIPQTRLQQAGLTAGELASTTPPAGARAILSHYGRAILAGFEAGERYLSALPRRHWRLRLASLWPLVIGLGTLEQLLRQGDHWPAGPAAKVERRWVYRMLLLSLPLTCSHRLTQAWLRRLRQRCEAALQ